MARMVDGIAVVYLCIAVVFQYLSTKYREQKTKEYSNDERWKMVVTKANSVELKYYTVVTVGVLFAKVGVSLIPENRLPVFTLDQIVTFAFYVFLSRYII